MSGMGVWVLCGREENVSKGGRVEVGGSLTSSAVVIMQFSPNILSNSLSFTSPEHFSRPDRWDEGRNRPGTCWKGLYWA